MMGQIGRIRPVLFKSERCMSRFRHLIVEVEACRAIRQAGGRHSEDDARAAEQRFDLKPAYLAADTAYGSAETLNWIVNDKKISPHIPGIDRSNREDGTFSRADFIFDKDRNAYVCPNGKLLDTTGTVHAGYALRYRASKSDCDACALKTRCCLNTPMRYVPRDLHEDARDIARALAKTEAFEQSRRYRKRVEMLFAHLKGILRLGKTIPKGVDHQISPKTASSPHDWKITDFCNKIGHEPTWLRQ